MQIVYKQNPLRTEVILDEAEKKELWYKTKIEEMRSVISNAFFRLEEGDCLNLQRAREILDIKRFYSSKDKKAEIDERTDESYNEYLDALRDLHIGDCTCVAMSCIKCRAEDMLGIDTIKGLGQHAASFIQGTFSKDGKEDSIEDALDYLRNYKPHADWEGWEVHAERWRQEAKEAYEWLVKYRDEHFPKDGSHVITP